MRTTLLLLAATVLYLVFKGMWDSPDWIWFLAASVGFLYVIGAGNRTDRQKNQSARDKKAQAVADRRTTTVPSVERPLIGAQNPKAQILFLRPFPVDGQITAQNPRKDSFAAFTIPFYRMALPSRVSLDDAMAYFLKGQGELVAIGRVGQSVGASRVVVGDSKWREYFITMARDAHALIFLLGTTPSTLWEFERAANEPALLSKSVFILPPSGGSRPKPVFESAEDVAQQMKARGIEVNNPLAGHGYTFNVDGSIRAHAEVISRSFGSYSIQKRKLRGLLANIASGTPV